MQDLIYLRTQTFHFRKKIIIALVVVCLLLIGLLIILAFILSGSSTEKSAEEDDPDVDYYYDPSSGGGGGSAPSSAHPPSPPSPTVTTTTTTTHIPHYFIMCTIGATFRYDDRYKSANCDYFIFDGILPTNSGFIGSEDQHAWNAFKHMTWTGNPKPEFGVSFPGKYIDDLTDQIFGKSAEDLNDLLAKGYRSFGVLNCFGTATLLSRPNGGPFGTLFAKIFNSMTASQRKAGLKTFFVGLHLSAGSTAQSSALMRSAANINHLNLLILQTHITPLPAVTSSPCFIYPTASWSQTPIKNSSYSSVQRAAQMFSAASSTDLYFGISFSLRANFYQLSSTATATSAGYTRPCLSSISGDFKTACNQIRNYFALPESTDCTHGAFDTTRKYSHTYTAQPCMNTLYNKTSQEVQYSPRLGVLLVDVNMDNVECQHWSGWQRLQRVKIMSDLLLVLRRANP
ncbi:uncharacterized protein LOC135397235 [Ornithodoros turicata]|uniref:uncharacterized protein LOC135397235 n=1 Tax=Ornithodoros turicata TaxID=34597 RepID=UPI00313A20D1